MQLLKPHVSTVYLETARSVQHNAFSLKAVSSLNPRQTSDLAFDLTFHHFSPLNCCLSVILRLDKGDYPHNLQTVFWAQ